MEIVYKVGIIGCGGISHMHTTRYLAEQRTEVIAISDIDEDRLKAYGEQYNIEQTYTNYIEMLETADLDIVSVCTRPKFHAPLVIESAKHGIKAILSEKPMAENLGQAREMVESCQQHDVKLAIDHQLRFNAPYVVAKQLIKEGKIGEVFRVHAVCGGGDLKDNATHTVDLMRYILGDLPVEWVIGQIDRAGSEMKYDLYSESFSLGYFKFENNIRGLIETGDDSAPGYHHIYCYGTDGVIELAVPGGPVIRLRTSETKGDWVTPDLPAEISPVQDMVASIDEDRPHRSDGQQGLATLELLMAIYESSRQRRRIYLPLEEPESPLTLMIEAGWI
ncbi:MAG: Gfo/Idh/MocA family oxidoreductase [Candidatus Poribacteria bacterium]|nr:Gfo/Idh/MocA family oxidoreductase [Candidatus Poribacteria bacterium]